MFGYTRARSSAGSPPSTCSTSRDARSSPPTSTRRVRGARHGQDVECMYLRADGSPLWVLVSESPLRAPDGSLVALLHRVSDYSARRRILDELTESRRQLAEGQRIARIGTWEWDVAPGPGHRLRGPAAALRHQPRLLPGDLRGGAGAASTRTTAPPWTRRCSAPWPAPTSSRSRPGSRARTRQWIWTRGRGRGAPRRGRRGAGGHGHPPGHHRGQAGRDRARGPGRPEHPHAGDRQRRQRGAHARGRAGAGPVAGAAPRRLGAGPRVRARRRTAPG